MNKEEENKIVEIVESCREYGRGFIRKNELIKKLEEAFPEE